MTNKERLINDWRVCHCSPPSVSCLTVWHWFVFQSQSNKVPFSCCRFRAAPGASFVHMGSVKWDGWQGDRGDVCHSLKGNAAARCTVALREERNVESVESLSEEAKRRTSRWKWKKDDENWEKELSIVVGEAEWEKKGREGAGGSIWKLVVLMAK